MLDDKALQSADSSPSGCRNVPLILFGSYARGAADEGSDFDLRVIEREIPK